MKNKTTIIIIFCIFFTISSKAQSFTPTPNIANSGAANNFKGGYTFSYATAGTPWNGSLISYGGHTNNYDTQISSDYGPDGGSHISYRTKNGDANTWNPWYELAIRGSNTFTGNQTILGNVGIGTSTPSNIQGWNKVLDVAGLGHSKIIATTDNSLFRVGIYSHSTWLGGCGFIGTESNHAFHLITNYSPKMSILTNGNVGIGVTNPINKLDVNGTIHSKEVKVDMTGWSDFVLKKEYELPTLEAVEKHIKDNGHLENIPSEEEVLKNGINLGEMNSKLLRKIEELTLYMIAQEKKNNDQYLEIEKSKNEIEILKNENKSFRSVLERLSKIEEKLK